MATDKQSTFSVSQTFTDSFPSSTTTSGGGGNVWTGRENTSFGDTNAPLYLYTFIAILSLLLVASSIVIIRTRINRQRQAITETIRNGTFARHHHQTGRRGSKFVDLGPKPVFWEASLGSRYPDANVRVSEGGSGQSSRGSGWGDLMPISTQRVAVALANSPGTNVSSPSINRWRSITPSLSSTNHTHARPAPPTHETSTLNTDLRVSLFIAMPCPSPVIPASKIKGLDDEWCLPHLELGSVDVFVNGQRLYDKGG
ncbi:hypothetical protein PM082_004290 [Marasmius tenuissimus]|nr:hypothetical protein PM082_004290 [Marasmius tenuissimus]